jgi:hypothetical protein
MMRVEAVVLVAGLVAAGCVDRLPAQDRRIVAATPVAKMSVEDLSKDYQGDHQAADRRYWGKAIEVSGIVSDRRDDDGDRAILFKDAKTGATLVEAGLLDDQAAAILEGASTGTRITLKCYCAGLDEHVTLRSCVTP